MTKSAKVHRLICVQRDREERKSVEAKEKITKRNYTYRISSEGEREMAKERCGDLCIRVRREVDAAIIIYRCKILSHRWRQWRGKPAVNRTRVTRARNQISRVDRARFDLNLFAADSFWRVTSSTCAVRHGNLLKHVRRVRVKYRLARVPSRGSPIDHTWNYDEATARSLCNLSL